MLFAAEGGGFFSSSASGYSNGLALLLLGHNKNQQQPKPTNPWNHYHLVLEDSDSATTSSRSCLSSTCTSLVCFRRKSQRRENPGRLPPNSPALDYNGGVSNRFALKSSLKKRSFSDVVLADEDGVLDHADRRKVQWPDTCGIEIAEVREFEPSEVDASDDEFQGGSGKSCMCTIM